MTSHLAPPIELRQRRSFTVLRDEPRRRTRTEASTASPQPRKVSDIFFRFESPGAGSSKQANVSPSKRAVEPEQRHHKATHRLQDKIMELEIRARTAIADKNNVQNELSALQHECRRSAEREAALRVALERAEACLKGDREDGQNSLVLQRKLEDLERLHADTMHRQIAESEVIRRKLEQAQKTIQDQDDLIILWQQQAADKDHKILSQEAAHAKQEEELESLRLQLREAEVRQLAGRNAVDTLSHERKRHESTKAKLKALQASISSEQQAPKAEGSNALRSKLASMEASYSTLESKYDELRSAARTLADEFELQSSQLGVTRQLLADLVIAYGRLATQNRVERQVFEGMKLEKRRLQLLSERLATELADRQARVHDLQETVAESRDACKLLEAAVEDSEQEIRMLRGRSLLDATTAEAERQDLYLLLGEYFQLLEGQGSDDTAIERARAEEEIETLCDINDTLERTLQAGYDIKKKLLNIEHQFTTFQAHPKQRGVPRLHVTSDDISKTPNSEATSPSATTVDGTGKDSRRSADGVSVGSGELHNQLDEGVGSQPPAVRLTPAEQSHETLTREVATLLSQKSLGEDDMRRLSELSAAVLERTSRPPSRLEQ